MRTLILGIVFIATASGLSAGLGSEGPVFDRDGRLTSYLYADGTSDSYKYDSQLRMTSFIGRNGEVTTFKYSPDGSMTTVYPDGSVNESAAR
jgi:YD repeat-containing protein